MSTEPSRPFVLVGDPSAAACEGDFCPVPEVDERAAPTEDEEQTLAPAEKAARPGGR